MNVWDIMDCAGCDQRVRILGRVGADPDRCYPAEEQCRQNAPDSGPCGRMLEALANVVQRGELETARGSFYALEELQERQRDEGDADWIKDYDFSSASYWWMPNEYEPGRAHSEPRPYQNVAAIFDAWFQ